MRGENMFGEPKLTLGAYRLVFFIESVKGASRRHHLRAGGNAPLRSRDQKSLLLREVRILVLSCVQVYLDLASARSKLSVGLSGAVTHKPITIS